MKNKKDRIMSLILKNKFTIILAILSFLFGLSFRYIQPKVNKAVNLTNITINKLFQKSSCKQDLRINELDKDVRNNRTIMDIIKTKCLWVMAVDRFDVTGDGKPELIVNVADAGCADCRTRMVVILDGENILFQKIGDEIEVNKTKFPINGFQIREILRRQDEPLCCPTEGIVYTYAYDPNLIQEIKNIINSGGISLGTSNYFNQYFYLYDARSELYKKE